jgi:PPK2 family polyphosphate:nucleotide phosphotransferase
MPIAKVTGSIKLRLKGIDPDDRGGMTKEESIPLLKAQKERIRDLQERLFAEDSQSLLIVFQAIDTGGKDGTIRNVFSGINPQGCRVWSFGVPSEDELAHDVFWRYHQHTPARGMIGIFNRSYFEEVIVVRVKGLATAEQWKHRYEQINEFERILSNGGTRIIKFYLHISKDEQKERLQTRLDDPEKHWKFNVSDLDDRALWNDYQEAFEDAINKCSTLESPWFVVPANRKWYRNYLVAKTVADTLESMNPQWPEAEPNLETVIIPD